MPACAPPERPKWDDKEDVEPGAEVEAAPAMSVEVGDKVFEESDVVFEDTVCKDAGNVVDEALLV